MKWCPACCASGLQVPKVRRTRRRAADSAECPPLLSERRGQEAHTIQEFRPALNIEDFFVKYFALARDGQPNGQEMPNLLQLAVLMQAHDDEIRVTRPPRIILYE